MQAIADQAVNTRYELVRMSTSVQEKVEINARSIEEVRAWAMANVDTSCRWIIKLDGRNIGEAIVVEGFTYDTEREKVTKRQFNSTRMWARYFASPAEALADYRSHLDEASARLDEIGERIQALKEELSFDLGYHMEGDTHGIDEDYQYVSVNIAGYDYRRKF